ncbi:MAG: Holliday junction resolvase RuvX [Candidatus Magasanikbacteria bacterium]
MNILSIDYGTKNIGLAWCDSALGVVLPYGNVDAKKWKIEIVKLIETEKIHKAVVGLPVGLDGKENENTKRVRNFADELRKLADIPIEFIDERFSSHAADRMGEGGASRDERAAMIILQTYLDKLKK